MNFKTSCSNIKIRGLGAKLCVALLLNLKSSCILLSKNISFGKNETESKMGNPTHSFRETNLVLQLMYKLQIKSKTAELVLEKEERGQFLYCIFCGKEILLTFLFHLNV